MFLRGSNLCSLSFVCEFSERCIGIRIERGFNGDNVMLRLFYVISCVFSFVNGAWMLLFPRSWYTDFPADIPHTGPFNQHFVRDLGVIYLVVALAFGWSTRNIDRSRPVHLALTV